ncbi:MAG: tRNA (adenosine(37)-N6)-threonylcarbamoyltransferase complex ATPase subunit type 1 TsaE, partial [Firmicutes bacterium]|nr:tRNA (adenosine(37)-N6)-threonylcarbamoyltransferase complex ATPase subunit type 1 TsaE [Bacillota bacterium]
MSGKSEILISRSEKETEGFGRKLAEGARSGEVYALDGNLGTGKTVLARGFARGLGISGTVSSPTFTMVHEYRSGRLPLYHFDIYRLPDEDALYDIGWDEYLEAGGVCLV